MSVIADTSKQRGEWSRWIPLTTPDGTPIELDGSPIFDRRNVRLDRAFRIIQHALVGNDVELAAWLKHDEEGNRSGMDRTQLHGRSLMLPDRGGSTSGRDGHLRSASAELRASLPSPGFFGEGTEG